MQELTYRITRRVIAFLSPVCNTERSTGGWLASGYTCSFIAMSISDPERTHQKTMLGWLEQHSMLLGLFGV